LLDPVKRAFNPMQLYFMKGMLILLQCKDNTFWFTKLCGY
jgi:hypothetical protein